MGHLYVHDYGVRKKFLIRPFGVGSIFSSSDDCESTDYLAHYRCIRIYFEVLRWIRVPMIRGRHQLMRLIYSVDPGMVQQAST
jgi:hypothetical protein